MGSPGQGVAQGRRTRQSGQSGGASWRRSRKLYRPSNRDAFRGRGRRRVGLARASCRGEGGARSALKADAAGALLRRAQRLDSEALRAFRVSSQKLPSSVQPLTRRRRGGRAGEKEPGLRVMAKLPRAPRSRSPGVDRSTGEGTRRAGGPPPRATCAPARGRCGAGLCRQLPPLAGPRRQVWGPGARGEGPASARVRAVIGRPRARATDATTRRVFHLQPCGGS